VKESCERQGKTHQQQIDATTPSQASEMGIIDPCSSGRDTRMLPTAE